MGRKTLLQSTGKKVNTKKKEEEEKKRVGGAKKAASSKSKRTATKPKKTKAAAGTKTKKTKKSTVKTAAPKAKKTAKTKAKQAETRTKKPSKKELLFKKFDSAMPEKPPESPFAKQGRGEIREAPPFFSTDSKEEAERMRNLLFKQFDLHETPSV